MKLPPQHHAPLVSATTAAQALTPTNAHPHGVPTASMPFAPAHVETGLHYGGLFRLPRHLRQAGHHRPAAGGGGLPRRRAAGSRASSPGQLGDQDDLDEGVEDEESRRARLASAMQAQTSFGGSDEQGSSGQGSQQERRFAVIARNRLARPVGDDDERAAQQLLARTSAAQSPADLAPALRAAGLQGRGSLASLFVRVSQAWQASRGGGSPAETTTLAGVKAALVRASAGEPAPAHAGLDERRAAASLWLPVYLLNLNRPRSAAQRMQAAARLGLIDRALQRAAAGATASAAAPRA